MNRFTHIARIYGIRCRYNEYTDEIEGIGSIRQALIAFCIAFDMFLFGGYQSDRIELVKEL